MIELRLPRWRLHHHLSACRAFSFVFALAVAAACSPKSKAMNQSELNDFATRYAAAWSSQSAEKLASFYTSDGSLTVNAGKPAIGRDAVRAAAQSFMSGFPDMVVRLDSIIPSGSKAVFHWTWTGTNTGPGGTGRPVRISGYEEWTLSPDGLITESLGHYDEAEYQRQMEGK